MTEFILVLTGCIILLFVTLTLIGFSIGRFMIKLENEDYENTYIEPEITFNPDTASNEEIQEEIDRLTKLKEKIRTMEYEFLKLHCKIVERDPDKRKKLYNKYKNTVYSSKINNLGTEVDKLKQILYYRQLDRYKKKEPVTKEESELSVEELNEEIKLQMQVCNSIKDYIDKGLAIQSRFTAAVQNLDYDKVYAEKMNELVNDYNTRIDTVKRLKNVLKTKNQ